MKDDKPLEPIETAESPLLDISYSSTETIVPVTDNIKRDLERCQDTLNMFHKVFSEMMVTLGSIDYTNLRNLMASVVRFPEGVTPGDEFTDDRSFQRALFDFARDSVNHYIADGHGFYHRALYYAPFGPINIVIDADTPSRSPAFLVMVNTFGA